MVEANHISQKWRVECDHASKILPVLIHTRQQQLINRLRISSAQDVLPRNVSVRMAGLVETACPIAITPSSYADGIAVFEQPQNPTITFSTAQIDRTAPTKTVLEVLIQGERVWGADVLLHPARATPTDIKYALSLASFVQPQAREVVELIKRARESTWGAGNKSGFPSVDPVQAAKSIYLQLARSREPAYAWEPGPHNLFGDTQLVRLPQQVFGEGQASCLDLALVLCAGFEHIRRLPVLIAINMGQSIWHVIPGVRTNDDADIPDEPLLFNLAAINDSCHPSKTFLFDPEALVHAADPDEADALARQRVQMAKQAFLLDIQAARNAEVWPVPISDSLHHGLQILRPDPIHIEYHDDVPDDLVQGISSGRAVVLLGDALDAEAGISRAALADALSQAAGLESQSDLLRAGYRIEKENGREALIQVALKTLTSRVPQAAQPYDNLAALPVQTVISFHPDALLERSLLRAQPPFRILLDDGDLADLPLGHSSRELYLLGGSALGKKGLVLTFDDQDRLLLRIKLLARGLRARLASGPILMLACNLDDSNFQELYLEATRHLRRPRTIYLSGCRAPRHSKLPIRVLSMSPARLLETLQRILPSTLPQPPALANPKAMRRPYKFLDYFEAEDQDFFFGRDDEKQLLTAEVMASRNRVAVLCGRSGVGKTSLVKAALIPHLEQTHHIQTSYIRGGTNLQNLVTAALNNQESSTERLLIIDQTEEALIKLGVPALQTFFANLSETLSDRELSIRVLLIVREDYLGRLAVFQPEFPQLLSSVSPLKGLTRAAAQAAIVFPAVNCGMTVEEKVIEEILDDLSPDLIFPAHLQIICDQLYERCRQNGAITLEDYNSLGRAANILRNHLENAVQQLPDDLEGTARKILRAMVTTEQTKEQLSLDRIIARETLPVELAERAMHELIHVHRLVRELSGDPIRYELSHESLTASVAGWLDAKDAKARIVQEILDQEVSNLKMVEAYRLPRDRMRLINDYRLELHLDDEAVFLLCSEFYIAEDLPEFWRQRLCKLPASDQFRVLWRAFRESREKPLNYILDGERRPLFTLLPATEFPDDVAEPLTRLVVSSTSEALAAGIKLALLDITGSCEELLLKKLQSIPTQQAHRVVQAWFETEVRPDPTKSTTQNPLLALARLLLRVLDLPEATQQILNATSKPLLSVLLSPVLLKAIHQRNGFEKDHLDFIAAVLSCLPSGGELIDKLAYRWLADSIESFPVARQEMQESFLRLTGQHSESWLRSTDFTVLLLTLIRLLQDRKGVEDLGMDRYLHLLNWVQQLDAIVIDDEPSLVEEAICELARFSFLDPTHSAEEAVIIGFADMPEKLAQSFARNWTLWLPDEPVSVSSHKDQRVALARILSRILPEKSLAQVFKVLAVSTSQRVLAHDAIGQSIDVLRARLYKGRGRQLLNLIAELPKAENLLEDLAKQWLITQLDESSETNKALEAITLDVIQRPELYDVLSHIEYSAILQGISVYLQSFEQWTLIPADKASQILAVLELQNRELSIDQEYLVRDLVRAFPDSYFASRINHLFASNPKARKRDSVDLLQIDESETPDRNSLKDQLAVSRILCRWGHSLGLVRAIDILKREDLSFHDRRTCAECFKISTPETRKLVINERLGSGSSSSKLVDALLDLSDVKWLLDDSFVLDWLLRLKLKDARLTRLRQLLLRLMPELIPVLTEYPTTLSNNWESLIREYEQEYKKQD